MQKKNTGISMYTIIIAIICTVFVTFVVYKKINDRFTVEIPNEVVDSQMSIGTEIDITGLMTKDGDIMNYTHRLHTAEYGSIGLKSSIINLNKYDGQIYIKGKINKIIQNMYIIEVDNVVGNEVDIKEEQKLGIYKNDAGIYFSDNFMNKYNILESNKNGEIKIQNKSSLENITISYFLCTKSDPNKDCNKLNRNFVQIAEKSFVAKGGMVFYKLAEISTWFFGQDENRGYFISNVSEQEVMSFIELVEFPNKEFIKNKVLPYANIICNNNYNQLQEVDNYNIIKSGQNIIVEIEGKSGIQNAKCIININPSIIYGGELISMQLEIKEDDNKQEIEDDKEDDEKEVQDINNIENIDSNEMNFDVQQFPINLEKKTEFSSKRGYKIIFPSGNITWRPGYLEDKSLGHAGLNCFSQINVTKYDKENPEIATTNPSIIIHECIIKNSLDLPNKFINYDLDTKEFLIEILDPSWKEFVENIIIELLEEQINI